jgi:hypothetical protein
MTFQKECIRRFFKQLLETGDFGIDFSKPLTDNLNSISKELFIRRFLEAYTERSTPILLDLCDNLAMAPWIEQMFCRYFEYLRRLPPSSEKKRYKRRAERKRRVCCFLKDMSNLTENV